MSTLSSLLAVAAAGYLLAVAGLYVGQRRLIYFPQGPGLPPAAAGLAEMAVVRARSADGVSLVGWYAPPRRPGLVTVVMFHGNSGQFAHRAGKLRCLLDAGYGVYLASYRGFEGNGGSPSEEGLYADARAALAWLAERGVSAARLVLYGESLGTGVAVQMAAETPVAAVVLEAPFTSIPDVGAGHYPLLPVRWLTWDRFDSLAKIGRVAAPILILHGERDQVVPVASGRALLAAAREPKQGVFLPDADHGDIGGLCGDAVLAFLSRHGGAAG